MSTREPPLLQAAEEHGPFDIVFEAAGASSVTLESMQALRRNGVLVLTGYTRRRPPKDRGAGEPDHVGVCVGKKVVVGSVNAKRTHFELSVQDMALAEALYPGWLESLLTRPVQELDNYEEMIRLLIEEKEAIRFLSRAVAGCQDSSKLPSVGV
jgi:glucose 1-dehydrogenase